MNENTGKEHSMGIFFFFFTDWHDKNLPNNFISLCKRNDNWVIYSFWAATNNSFVNTFFDHSNDLVYNTT